MTLPQLKAKFDSILTRLNSNSSVSFSTVVEAGYEALALAHVMQEYHRVYGQIRTISPPSHTDFLNQSPGRFLPNRAFKIEFDSGDSFYFAADVEVWGLDSLNRNNPGGIKFEADVVVIPVKYRNIIQNSFYDYPAPQHIHSAYECKFGKFHKGQLRELLGLRRHISFLKGWNILLNHEPQFIFNRRILNARPQIAIVLFRPSSPPFFDLRTTLLYDVQQIQLR